MWISIASGVGIGALVGRNPIESAVLTGATIGTAAYVRGGGLARIASLGHRVLMLTGYQLIGAVVAGAIVGTGISYIFFGKEGAKAAVDFYTNPFELKKWETIAKAPANLSAIMQADQAVENNAAGLPAGTRVGDSYLAGGRGNPAHSQYQESGAVTGYREMYGY